ncbi:MAG: NADH-quinone oxidoreductase subunit C [Actinobacteria bacterium]|nr:NADH-quinone oxidoreductase subunit C [Actinomycetota bacterium]
MLVFEENFGHGVAQVTPQRYREVAEFVRDDPDFALDYLDLVCGVDHGEEGITVVAQLYSTSLVHHLRLKVSCGVEDPVCPTLSDIFPGADWHERETAEMFGVRFEGHPNLVKLLLDDGFEGHPLRKDFKLMSREAKVWPGAVELEDDE